MKNKGFTLVELLAVIMILGIIMTIAIVSVSQYITSSRNQTYTEHEDTLKRAAQNYLLDHTDLIPQASGGETTITGQELYDGDYVRELEDPRSKTNCADENSYVIVHRDPDTIDAGKKNFNANLTYIVCLKCSNTYKSTTCRE